MTLATIRLSGFALAGAFVFVASTAQAQFLSKNGMAVNPVNAHTIEVIARGSVGKNSYWCAAGDYAVRKLGLPWKTQLYVVSDIGPAVTTDARSAVRFTVDPVAAGVTPFEGGYISNMTAVGVNKDLTFANGKCSRSKQRR